MGEGACCSKCFGCSGRVEKCKNQSIYHLCHHERRECSPRKKTLLQNQYFPEKFYCQTKIGHIEKKYLWKDKGKGVKRKDPVKSLSLSRTAAKHGGGSITFWGCSATSRTGPLLKANRIIKKDGSLQILQHHLKLASNQILVEVLH